MSTPPSNRESKAVCMHIYQPAKAQLMKLNFAKLGKQLLLSIQFFGSRSTQTINSCQEFLFSLDLRP